MRIDKLEFLKYGKFTDKTIELPQAEMDFHLVVGSNEAGKSTLRSAIVDLLYGIPNKKTVPYAFLHPMNELRLGATLRQGDQQLSFHRTKGAKQTVRSPADQPLADAALAPYLGTSDRAFFEQMFGLNHQRLVDGGHNILSAGSDIGQVLFESAAGISSLGQVRIELEGEGDSLWAARKSKDRDYYAALEEYDAAVATLKSVTIRSKEWSEAQALVERLAGELEIAREAHAALKVRMDGLERVRRVAPYLETLSHQQAEAAALGPVPDLPGDAVRVLDETQRDIAQARAVHETQQRMIAEADEALAGLELDESALALRDDITALNELRLQFRAHEGDIQSRQAEVDVQWKTAADAARQLGWDVLPEEALRQRMPPLPVRKSLEGLMRTRGALLNELQITIKAQASSVQAIAAVRDQLATLPAATVPVALQVALTAAQQLGDALSTQRKFESELARRIASEATAVAALGKWGMDIHTLRTLGLPRQDYVEGVLKAQALDQAEINSLEKRTLDLQAELRGKELAVAQYRDTYHPVSKDDVRGARRERDLLWQAIRQGEQTLATTAAQYEHLVATADGASDKREDTVQEASELQTRQQTVERLRSELAACEDARVRLQSNLAERLAQWAALMESSGLPGMPPDRLLSWADARHAAITAADAVADAQRELHDWQKAIASVSAALLAALTPGLEGVVADTPLAALVLHATGVIQTVNDAQGQRRALARQLEDALRLSTEQERAVTHARSAMDEWNTAWAQATAQLGILPQSDPEGAQASLDLIARIDTALTAMTKLRVDRIETMRADLAQLAAEADRLAKVVGWQPGSQPGADMARALSQRLILASEQKEHVSRWTTAQRDAVTKAAVAQARITELNAGLQPLLDRAGAVTHDELRAAIARSDSHRRIQETIGAAEKGLREGGDGLSVAQLIAAVDAVDRMQVVAMMQDLSSQMDALMEQQRVISAQLAMAKADLAKITGSDEAAKAEGKKQEALARMTTAIERYIKVTTAARLLKWSIDRYRETRQGPMLKRASDIFARLTLGSFDLLTVDFDHEPLALQGKRPGGALVNVEGMSEGTRDQLYLALRLAALHLHLEQAHALPFIADDLFINYDDRRSQAGLKALGELSKRTQVIFLTHHDHLVPVVQEALGRQVNVVQL